MCVPVHHCGQLANSVRIQEDRGSYLAHRGVLAKPLEVAQTVEHLPSLCVDSSATGLFSKEGNKLLFKKL